MMHLSNLKIIPFVYVTHICDVKQRTKKNHGTRWEIAEVVKQKKCQIKSMNKKIHLWV